MAIKNTASRLNHSQVIFLRTLATVPSREGMTIVEVEEKTGQSFAPGMIGIATRPPEESDPNSLYALGYVRAEKQEESRAVKWVITAPGRKIAEKVKTRNVLGDSVRVPAETLDRVAIAFCKTRTYQQENYTDEDMIELRSKLPSRFHDVPLDSLRQQVVTRRKVGAFVDPVVKRQRIVEKAIREYGKEGDYPPWTVDS